MTIFRTMFLSVGMVLAASALQAQVQEYEKCDPVVLYLADRGDYGHLEYIQMGGHTQWTVKFPSKGPFDQEDWTNSLKVNILSETLVDEGQYKSITGSGDYLNKYKIYTKKIAFEAREPIGFPRHLKNDITGPTNKLTMYVTCEKTKSIPTN